ncbi:hypothetical protein [Burkholderia multivorans]|uniref:hypothetical protein n=1 Tax=Burkholderia multivorans TaxID=87883 RepID=UPI00158C8118|nr:hypothetical protein [Burkholderia multivorans]MBU9398465.1 hypothetical protein [Burkholderia multivorans]MDN8050857.1 hypothetical protein [Burkholderia multivorans]MDR9238247.1 hypothetical protein [Burkholderia multivorans]MDR9268994.1 hypothetical protein [Burkholderia multivorans]MDR9285832.1 hypothetical protein [Burkholderia multivorans]
MGSISNANENQQIGNHLKKNAAPLDLLIFFVVAATLLVINWHLIRTNNLEATDFAANSLLVQKAKHFGLFTGNYSRVGFYHPGPAILYVLTLGELLLYDWTHLLPSPFSGQMVAVILYNAAWITIIFRTLRKIVGSAADAGVMLAVFLCIVAYQNFQFFAGMWFPELYFFPFATALVAASRFAAGKADALLPLALSTGFLINGHVSFVSTLGIIFALLLLYNHLQRSRLERSEYIFDRGYWKANSGAVARAVGVLFLFFIPLIIETIRHFPGPVASYISFGKQHHANTLGDTIRYSGQYWGGTAAFLAAITAMSAALVYAMANPRHFIRRNHLALLATLVSATAAMLFYSKFGVDELHQKYIGYFYYSVPALTITLLIAAILRVLPTKVSTISAAIAIPVLLGATAKRIDNTPDYAPFYNQPGIAYLYDGLARTKPEGRIVLNLDSRPNPAKIWETVLGLLIYAKRAGTDLVCINRNWHISYTKDAQCTASEVESNPVYEVSNAPVTEHASTDIEGAGLVLIKHPNDYSEVGFISAQKNRGLFQPVLNSGWSSLESEFVWMDAKEAHLLLKTGTERPVMLELDLGAFLPHPDSAHHLTIYVNNAVVYHTTFDARAPRQTIRIPIERAHYGRLDIKLVDPDVVSPKSVGISEDSRTLGVSLYGFGLVR